LPIPSISVIIPVFNREAEIGKCLKSLLRQDFQNFEAVVVNDGSTDGTVQAVESMDDPRIRVISIPENRGHASAGNTGICAAQGSLICFLDSDDEFLPGKLKFVHDFFLRQQNIDVLIDSFIFIHHDRGETQLRVHRNPELSLSSAIEDALYRRKLWKATGAISARRDALIKVGMWDESLKRRTDMDLVLRLAKSFRCASTSVVLWKKHSSVTAISSHRETFISALIDIVRRHPQYTSKSQWRSGLALDITTHMLTLLLHAKFSLALQDWQQLILFFGYRETVYYHVIGSMMLIKRIFHQGCPA
jgi:glycosyltransferase involved in cell wall biosynthesis